MEWKQRESKYESTEHLIFGKYSVMEITWNSHRSREDRDSNYRITCKLPGLKSDLGVFKTIEDAKEYAEKAANMWIRNAGV